jgi:dipeptidyl aminopeptidase/acylaminoacyl peptidase
VSGDATPSSTFADLAAFVAVPRLAGLAISPDGTRLVTVISELDPKGTRWRGALWQVDPTGGRDAVRLTRSAEAESAPVYSADGDLLFLSRRADPLDTATDPAPCSTLWCLPRTGEARPVVSLPGGVSSVVAAHAADTLLLGTAVHPGRTLGEDDAEQRSHRRDAGVSAVLHESYPVRHWDHDLGPDLPRLAVRATDGTLTDLTPDLDDRVGSAVLSPDGASVVLAVQVERGRGLGRRQQLQVVAADGSGRRVLLDSEEHDLTPELVLADGSAVICTAEQLATRAEPPRVDLWRVELSDGAATELTGGFEHWATAPVESADGRALYVVADCGGRAPVWRVDLAAPGAAPERLTADGAFSDLVVAPDGSALYGLRSAVDSPPRPVRLDLGTGAVAELAAPGALEVPGRLAEVEVVVADGRTVRGFLALPELARPGELAPGERAPLLVWVHGGPLGSWNAWTWRWNPWTATARGYAVLLPDPALSTGYGPDFLTAGWPAWGGAPYTDVLALTDTALLRDDLDPGRTALMGGSFGGYMANWVATQTDRFDAIVTHASLWDLDSFTGATDSSFAWLAEMGDPLTDRDRIEANSPHLRVADIGTPVLVIHGDKDYRVPIGEGLRLWFDLVRHEVPAKFLYFPDENHWVLTPGNAQVWYSTVFAFLAEHVLGQDWERPGLL